MARRNEVGINRFSEISLNSLKVRIATALAHNFLRHAGYKFNFDEFSAVKDVPINYLFKVNTDEHIMHVKETFFDKLLQDEYELAEFVKKLLVSKKFEKMKNEDNYGKFVEGVVNDIIKHFRGEHYLMPDDKLARIFSYDFIYEDILHAFNKSIKNADDREILKNRFNEVIKIGEKIRKANLEIATLNKSIEIGANEEIHAVQNAGKFKVIKAEKPTEILNGAVLLGAPGVGKTASLENKARILKNTESNEHKNFVEQIRMLTIAKVEQILLDNGIDQKEIDKIVNAINEFFSKNKVELNLNQSTVSCITSAIEEYKSVPVVEERQGTTPSVYGVTHEKTLKHWLGYLSEAMSSYELINQVFEKIINGSFDEKKHTVTIKIPAKLHIFEEIASQNNETLQYLFKMLDSTFQIGDLTISRIINLSESLPDFVRSSIYIVGTGNREQDSFQQQMPTQLVTRVMLYQAKPEVDDWLEYAHGRGIHPVVQAYVATTRVMFREDEDSSQAVTPRSLENLSLQLMDVEMLASVNGLNSSEVFDYVSQIVAGCIGDSAVPEFMTVYSLYYKGLKSLGTPEDILRGNLEKFDKVSADEELEKKSILWLLGINFLRYLEQRESDVDKIIDEKGIDEVTANILEFMDKMRKNNMFTPEFEVAFIKRFVAPFMNRYMASLNSLLDMIHDESNPHHSVAKRVLDIVHPSFDDIEINVSKKPTKQNKKTGLSR